MLLQSPIPVAAVRDTITRIVLERGYREDVTTTLLTRFWDWLGRLLSDLFTRAVGSRGTYIIVLALLAVFVGIGIARAAIVARARRQVADQRELPATADEQLAQAHGLAAQGAFVHAAHLLYAAIVSRLVEQKRVRRHPSKTVGDYGRELRSAANPLTAAYGSFARAYDEVAYGDGLCDAGRYARLETLAAPLLQPLSRPAAVAPSTARAA